MNKSESEDAAPFTEAYNAAVDSAAKIAELEARLAEASRRHWVALNAAQGLIAEEKARIAELEARLREAEAQLAETKLALVETIEDATEGAEKHIQRAEAAEARIRQWEAQARRADTALADLEAEVEQLRTALERIENAAIEKGGDALPYIIAEAQTILEGRAEAAEARINELEARLRKGNYRVQVHSDIAAENNLLRCQAEARAEAAKAKWEFWEARYYGRAQAAEADVAQLRAALEAVVKLRNGNRLYFVLNHHNGVTEELLRPQDKHTDMIVAALSPAGEQPDCDHPFRCIGDVCLNCGEMDEQPGESEMKE